MGEISVLGELSQNDISFSTLLVVRVYLWHELYALKKDKNLSAKVTLW